MALTQIDDRGLKTPIDLLDNEKIRLGTGNDLELYHDGSHSYLSDVGTGELRITADSSVYIRKHNNENMAIFTANGAVQLYYDNSKKFETTSYGVSTDGLINCNGTGGKILLADEGKLTFGGSTDLEIFHDGTRSAINNQTGDLRLINTGHIKIGKRTDAGSDFAETYANFLADGAVELYYDNSKKFETTNTGATVTGTAIATGLTINGATTPATINHTGGNALSLTRSSKTLAFNANYGASDTHATIDVDSGMALRFQVNSNDKITFDSSGNLGIGTTSPRSLLDLGAGSGDGALSSTLSQYQIMLEAPQGTGDYGRNIGWAVGTNGLTAAINAVDVGAGDSTGLAFITGTNSSVAERMRIDSVGKISTGGETAPDVDAGGLCLHTGSSDGLFFSCKNSDINHGRTSLDQTDTLFSMRKISSAKGGVDIRGYTDQAGGDPGIRIFGVIEDGTSNAYCPVEIRGARKNTGGNTGTSAMSADRGVVRISNDGDFTVATFTGEGLCFHDDTSDSNALDDYEEGTHETTVTISGNTSFSYSSRNLAYTKIGRVVHVVGRINLTGAGGGSSFEFTLPFACADGGPNYQYETSNEFQVIRGSDSNTFRIREGESSAKCQSDGSAGAIGDSSPHLNVNLTYFA